MLKKIPHTYVIVFSIIVISAILTWIVPGGLFDRHIITVNGIDRNVVIPGSFHYTGNNPQTWQVFSALFDGFVDKADIIIFILIIGGAFWIMNESKAIDVAIQSFLRFSKKIEHNVIIAKLGIEESTLPLPVFPVLTVLFGVTGIFSLRKSVHFFIIQILLFTILVLIAGVMGYSWYIMEIATLFFAMGLITGIAMNYNPNKITKLFLDGVKDIQSAAIIVGLAGGIIIILNNGNIIDTLLFKLSESISGMGKMASVGMMYVVQNLINLVMPSGSAKAALTMPMMSQFSDLIGVSRQATVMAFQFGDGFTNMLTPTSGVLLGVLSVAKIPYDKWVRWVLPLIIIMVVIGFLLLIPTVYMDLKGF